MNPAAPARRANDPMPPPAENSPRNRSPKLPRFLLAAFVFSATVWLGSIGRVRGLENAGWPAALFVLLALATTLASLARTLPVQNVLAAAAVTAFIASIAEFINAEAAMPFGQRTFTGDMGLRCFGVLPLAIPAVWVVAILNSRGVARLILRPWRKTSKYGFWVIGVTAVLVVLFDLSLEPFAGAAQPFWIWWTAGNLPSWQGAPFYNFIGWLVVSLLILAFVTPWLINKNPARKAPPDYHPLIVWLLINLLPASGRAMAHLWPAVVLTVVMTFVVTAFALRGARW